MDYAILSLLAVVLVSLISLIGAITLTLKNNYVKKVVFLFVSLAAGTLIGDVFIHIIPELYEEKGVVEEIGIMILVGITFFFILEKFLHWRHCHSETTVKHQHPIATNNLVADGLHNFIDGLAIAIAFMSSTEVGIATTIAVILHEIPQEIGDFGVLIHSGMKASKALLFNFISAIFAVLGAISGLIVGDASENYSVTMLAFIAGGFLYIAIADLIPEIKHDDNWKKSLLQLVAFIFGIILMYALTVLE